MVIENSSSNEEILNNNVNPNNGQPQNKTEEVIPLEQYKALQSNFTSTRQSLIEMAVERGTSDPSSISKIKDKSLQDSVVKNIY